jgi:flagellar capping protein FliD
MNESLAKQLHDLIKNYKISVADEINDTTRRVNIDLENMENDINILIKENKTQEKPNEQQ